MSLEQIESDLLSLSPADRQEFARWFYDNENRFLGSERTSETQSAARSEIKRRLEELRSNPGLGIPVTDEWFDNLKTRLRNAQASQAPSR
jgi:hypothetical protein